MFSVIAFGFRVALTLKVRTGEVTKVLGIALMA